MNLNVIQRHKMHDSFTKRKKLRLAVIVPGGVGAGYYGNGIPIIVKWVEYLSKEVDLTVFSSSKINLDYHPNSFKLIGTELLHDASMWKKIRDTFALIKIEHQKKPFTVFQGLWAFSAGFLAVMAAKYFKAKSIVSLQGGDLVNIPSIAYGGNRGFLKPRLNYWTLNNCDAITVLSKFHFQTVFNQKLQKKTSIIPYGLDLKEYPFREKEICQPLSLIHIANLNNVKDQYTLLRAFRLIQEKFDAQLTILGADYYDGKIQAFCKELNLENKVFFKGFQSSKQVREHLKKADILLHSSLFEGMSVVAIEAFATGVLVCGTKVGIFADLSDKCCLTAEVLDNQGLALQVEKLVKNSPLQKQLRKTAFEWAKKHDMNWTIQKFLNLYGSLDKK